MSYLKFISITKKTMGALSLYLIIGGHAEYSIIYRIQVLLQVLWEGPRRRIAGRQSHCTDTPVSRQKNKRMLAPLIMTIILISWLGGVTVMASDLRSSGRGFDFRSGRYQAT